MKTRRNTFVQFYTVGGVLMGFLILHPLSRIITTIDSPEKISALLVILSSFNREHLIMGLYFSLIGGTIGILGGFLQQSMVRKYESSLELIKLLRMHNAELVSDVGNRQKQVHLFAQDIWPTLVKVQKGLDLISDIQPGSLSTRQTQIHEVTKENIENIFRLLDILIKK